MLSLYLLLAALTLPGAANSHQFVFRSSVQMFITFISSADQIQQIIKQKLSKGLQSVAGVSMCDRPLF